MVVDSCFVKLAIEGVGLVVAVVNVGVGAELTLVGIELRFVIFKIFLVINVAEVDEESDSGVEIVCADDLVVVCKGVLVADEDDARFTAESRGLFAVGVGQLIAVCLEPAVPGVDDVRIALILLHKRPDVLFEIPERSIICGSLYVKADEDAVGADLESLVKGGDLVGSDLCT